MYKSSHSPAQTLEQLYQSKVEFYKKQFASRVPKEAWSRIDRRTIQSPRCLDKVDVTIYFPEDKEDEDDSPRNGICLHVHGGGLLWGDSHDQFAHRGLEMAQKLNTAVVSVEYSLFCRVNKNTNTFDPVNDVSIAIDWIETEGAAELNAKPSFVGSGESSGAHILLLAMLKHRDRGKANLYPPVPLQTNRTSSTTQSNPLLSWKCLNLVYGVYDLSGTPSIQTDGDSSSPLCGNDLLWLYDLYTTTFQNDGLLSTKDASVSPLYANLAHLPPALVSVGTADPLLDDSLFLANKYTSFGNHVELAIYEGGEHGIGHFGMQEDEEMGVRARENTLCFMKEYLQKKWLQCDS